MKKMFTILLTLILLSLAASSQRITIDRLRRNVPFTVVYRAHPELLSGTYRIALLRYRLQNDRLVTPIFTRGNKVKISKIKRIKRKHRVRKIIRLN